MFFKVSFNLVINRSAMRTRSRTLYSKGAVAALDFVSYFQKVGIVQGYDVYGPSYPDVRINNFMLSGKGGLTHRILENSDRIEGNLAREDRKRVQLSLRAYKPGNPMPWAGFRFVFDENGDCVEIEDYVDPIPT